MTNQRRLVLIAAAIALVAFAAGCKKTPTEETYDPQLLLDRLGVSVAPGGSEEVRVTATDEHNLPRSFTAVCDDEDIASVTSTDSTITVTGLSYGTTNVRVSSDTGTRVVPVQVYNPKVVDAGELLIAFVDEFEYRWCSMGPGGTWDASFYHPVAESGYHALGSYGFSGYGNPNGTRSVIVVKAKAGFADALKPPVDYDTVWDTQGSGIADDGSLWNPVPPPGYKALGTVAQQGFGRPSLDDVVCVREDLTVPGGIGESLFVGRNGRAVCLVAVAEPPVVGAHDSCYLATGTFSGERTSPDPSGQPALHVLKARLPMVPKAPEQSVFPKLTSYNEPEIKETAPVMAREISVPWTMVLDPDDSMMRYARSPNYRLERQVFYKWMAHAYNPGTVTLPYSVEVTIGAETTQSRKAWTKYGLELSVAVGVSFQGLCWGGNVTITGTVSKDFGYETQTEVNELRYVKTTTPFYAPPGKAVSLWQKYNRYILKRQSGNRFEQVASWDVGIQSYVTDEYPHTE